jgi:pyrimidine operon attenuation protein/uracil phosphoribosyltransferase
MLVAADGPVGKTLLDGEALRRTIARIAHEIVEGNSDLSRVALVGIHTRGVPIAQRLRRLIGEFAEVEPDFGTIDITFHRDDLHVQADGTTPIVQPVVKATKLDFQLEGATCVLVDDVMYTGRTARAAIETLFSYGRPARVQLACIADRGHRELPIRPDYVGKNLPTSRGERIHVQLMEIDEIDGVVLVREEGDNA